MPARSATPCATFSRPDRSAPRSTTRFRFTCNPASRCWATSRAIFPIAESAARETLALPIYPELSDEQQRFVVGSIRQYLDAHAHAHLATTDRAA